MSSKKDKSIQRPNSDTSPPAPIPKKTPKVRDQKKDLEVIKYKIATLNSLLNKDNLYLLGLIKSCANMPSPSPKKKMVQELMTDAKNTIQESRSEIGLLEQKQKSMTAEYAQGLPNSQEATPTSVTTLSTEPLIASLGFVTPQRQKGTPPSLSNNAAGFTATASTSGAPTSPTGRVLAEAFSNGFLMEGTDSRVLEFLTAASKPMQTLEASKTDPTHQMDWDELATL